MAVLQVKHVPMCKLCTAASAELINALLEKRHNKERDAEGSLITYKTITESLSDFGVTASLAAVKRHVSQGHIEFCSEEEAEARAAAEEAEQESWERLLDRVLGDGWQERIPDPDDIGRLQRAAYVKGLLADARAGKPIRVSHDQVNRSIAETTKRKNDDFQHQLILAMARASSPTGKLATAPQGELESQTPIVTDYEIVEPEGTELTDGGYEEDEDGR